MNDKAANTLLASPEKSDPVMAGLINSHGPSLGMEIE